jgi:hypothetical protein
MGSFPPSLLTELQAASFKRQATSFKRQATSFKGTSCDKVPSDKQSKKN